MSQYRRLLVFAEHPDTRSLERVVCFAERHGVEISLCDVVPSPPGYLAGDDNVQALETAALSAAYARLHRFCSVSTQRSDVAFIVLTGSPYIEVIREVVQSRYDLLVHLRRPSTAGDRDSNFEHFARKCPCPVWGITPTTNTAPAQLVVALDRGTADSAGFVNSMAQRCLAAAEAFVEGDATLHLLHAWQPYGVGMVDVPSGGSVSQDLKRSIDQQRSAYTQWFQRAVDVVYAQLPENVALQPRLYEGTLAAGLTALRAEVGQLRVVMGTVGADAYPGLLIGGTAETVLGQALSEVTIVKPAHFVSPLQFSRRWESPLALVGHPDV